MKTFNKLTYCGPLPSQNRKKKYDEKLLGEQIIYTKIIIYNIKNG